MRQVGEVTRFIAVLAVFQPIGCRGNAPTDLPFGSAANGRIVADKCGAAHLSDGAVFRSLESSRFRILGGAEIGITKSDLDAKLEEANGAVVKFGGHSATKQVMVPYIATDTSGHPIEIGRLLGIDTIVVLDKLASWEGKPSRTLYAKFGYEKRWHRFFSTDKEKLCIN